jgi:hypothetical protein
MRILFETVFGSHLYGTSTPTSDHDFKGVYLPSAREILLPKTPDVKTFNTGSSSVKNTAEDVDRELYSLHKFFDMLIKGDMNAYEMLFAPHDGSSIDWNHIVKNRDRMLTRECRGFVGYVQRQAATYGVRGERFNEVQALVDHLLNELWGYNTGTKLQDVPGVEQKLKAFCEGKLFTSWELITNNGRELFHLVCCDRKVPLSATIKTALDVYSRVLDNYGARARAAATNEGLDWKAVSHAVRIGEQAVDLLMTGEIVFPRPNAERLKAIKRGEVPYDEIAPYLDYLLETVEQLGHSSTLPAKPDVEFMDNLRNDHYEWEVIRNRIGGRNG